MTKPTLHPWLATPEASVAARKAVRIPLALLGGKAVIVGADELLSEAYAILTECALPPRERHVTICSRCNGSLENVRPNAKFCSRKCRENHKDRRDRGKAEAVPAAAASHIGAMWTWPEAEREKYAVREVGYRLRTQHHVVEIPASGAMANMRIALLFENVFGSLGNVVLPFTAHGGLTSRGCFHERFGMAERARRFLRVSTGKQDESKQLVDVDSYIRERGYQDDNRSYLAHGKSAYTGKHLAVLDQAFRDMADDQYEVLILWDSSRFTRMGAGSAFELMARARQAGGRVEFAASHAQQLNAASDWSPVMLALQATADKLESDRRRAHTRRDIVKHATTGSVHGKPSWGWTIEGAKDAKRFVPTPQGREFIPKMYNWVIDGTGCMTIAHWLTAQTGHIFNEGTVNRLIRNPLNYGHRRRGGTLDAEELIPYAVWQEAVMALESRRHGGGKKRTPNASLFIPVCLACFGEFRPGCNNGYSKMYKFTYPDRPDFPVFRCSGSGPQRRGCGARTVPHAELEAIILKVFGSNPQRYMAKVFVPSADSESVLKDLGRRIAEAAAIGDFDAVAELNAQAKAASEREPSRPHYDLTDSGMTKGEYFMSLGYLEQREHLKGHTIVASYDGERVTAGEVISNDDDGSPSAVHLWTP